MNTLGILISGRGSNMVAIADSVDAGRIPNTRIGLVIANKDAPGIAIAQSRGLSTAVIHSKGMQREDHDRLVVAQLRNHCVNLVCLAGYMRILSPWFVSQFRGQILNIHPSLLPAFKGSETAQTDAWNYGVKVSGCTVHLVDEEVDGGPIIVQKVVPVMDDDTADTLSARILVEEHIAYTEAINLILRGNLKLTGRRLVRWSLQEGR